MPPKPNKAATRAMTRNIKAQYNMVILHRLKVDDRYNAFHSK
jgi:hypothetical protein